MEHIEVVNEFFKKIIVTKALKLARACKSFYKIKTSIIL